MSNNKKPTCDEEEAKYSRHTSTYYQDCPCCMAQLRQSIEQLKTQIETGYGVVPASEFAYLVKRLDREENELRSEATRDLYVRVITCIYWFEVTTHVQAVCRTCHYRVDRLFKQRLDVNKPDQMNEANPWY